MEETKASPADSRAHTLPHGPALTRESPDFASRVQLVAHTFGPTRVLRVSNIAAQFLNAHREALSSEISVVEERPEDVVSVLPFRIVDGRLEVVGLECLRPALAARALHGLPLLADSVNHRMLAEIGGYMLGADGIGAAAIEILRTKAGIIPAGDIEFLGNITIPNAGVSPELSIAVAAEIGKEPAHEACLRGLDFGASRVAVPLSAQEIVSRFCQGTLSDPRFFDDVIELHGQLRAQGRCDGDLKAPTALRSHFDALLTNARTSPATNAKLLLTPDSVRDYMLYALDDDRMAVSARVSNSTTSPPVQLFDTVHLVVENVNAAGLRVGDAYHADALVRRHDILNVIVLAKVGDAIVIPINNGARAALELRDRTPHVVHTITGARNIEGVTGSLTTSYDDHEATTALVRDIVRRATGHEISEAPLLTSIQGYLSPGFNTTGFRVAVAVIELDESSASRLPPHTCFAAPQALLEAGVRDLSLRVAARVACLGLGLPARQRLCDFTSEERAGFHSIMLSDAPVWQFVREHSPRLREVITENALLANIITKRANDGGIQIERLGSNNAERYFFNSLMQSFMVHEGDNPLRIVQLLVHDFWHYEHPDPIPYVRGDGSTLELIPFEEYSQAVMRNEIDAVMLSEVVLPDIFGVEAFEHESESRSIASLLQRAGIANRDAQRDAVARALESGHLPDAVIDFLREESELAAYEPVIREKLLGYYVRDKLHNVRQLYDFWAQNAHVAVRAYAMGARFADEVLILHPYARRLEGLLTMHDGSMIRTGRNPLKEALGQLRTYGVYEPALRLEFIRGLLPPAADRSIFETIDTTCRELTQAYDELRAASESVVSIEETQVNADAYRVLMRHEHGVATRAKELIAALESDPDLLPAEQRALLSTRRHAPFPLLSFDPREDAAQQEVISNLLARAISSARPPR